MNKAEEVTVLLTGGAGYVGTHTLLRLLEGGVRAVVVDNMTLPPLSEAVASDQGFFFIKLFKWCCSYVD